MCNFYDSIAMLYFQNKSYKKIIKLLRQKPKKYILLFIEKKEVEADKR